MASSVPESLPSADLLRVGEMVLAAAALEPEARESFLELFFAAGKTPR